MGIMGKKSAAGLIEDLRAANEADRYGVRAAMAAVSVALVARDAAREAWREAEQRKKLAESSEAAGRGSGGAVWLAQRAESADATAAEATACEVLADREATHLSALEGRERAKLEAEDAFKPQIKAAIVAAVREAFPAIEAAVAANAKIQAACSAGDTAIGFQKRLGIVGAVTFGGLTPELLQTYRDYLARELGESF